MRAKMALYCSPDYQINWTFGSVVQPIIANSIRKLHFMIQA